MASQVTLKLLIDTKSRKVLFAEAGKEFVDFLFNLLSLPVGTVIKLLSKKAMVGSIGNLYSSVENLSDTYLQPNFNKEDVLNPKNRTSSSGDLPLLLAPNDDDLLGSVKFYQCPGHDYDVTDDPRAKCPTCKTPMTRVVNYCPFKSSSIGDVGKKKATSNCEGGFVKGVVTYMVVFPMSTISSITMLNKFHIKEVGTLEEKVVSFGINEGSKLLKASLQTNNVLTNVFIGA